MKKNFLILVFLGKILFAQSSLPYQAKEVSYENSSHGVKLAGILTVPEGNGPFPVALLISGSGPSNRDEEVHGHKLFFVLADHLARHNIASLRIDKRGIGESTGSYETATSADFASDILAGIQFLKTCKEINPKQIGLIGHSEGGAIAAMVAAKAQEVAFMVSMGGPAVKGEALLYEQGSQLQQALGINEKHIQHDRKLREKMFAIVKKESNFKKMTQKIHTLLEKYFAAFPHHQNVSSDQGVAVIHKDHHHSIVRTVASPWFRYFLTFDPAKHLKKVKVPILALGAEKDLQVPPGQNLPAIEKALRKAKHKDYTILELANHNHLFQVCKTGMISEYATIEESLSPKVLNTISDWILEKIR